MIYFTSDTHYGHKNILRLGEGRPFASIEEHDQALIDNWNRVVSADDTVYHLGDFAFASPSRVLEILRALRGNIKIIMGNHDRDDRMYKSLPGKVQVIPQCHEIVHAGTKIVVAHYPLLEWNSAYKGAWHLHGHTHGNLLDTGTTRLDMAVDCWNFTPASFEEIKAEMDKRKFIPVSHHGK